MSSAELGPVIGKGGFGIVSVAKYDDDESWVVVKKIPALGEAASKVANELRMHDRAGMHNNIAKIFGGYLSNDSQYANIVIELCQAGTLANLIDCCNGLEVSGVMRLAYDISQALHHLHKAMIVHRDLKPANIAFTADGIPKLIDFGLATLIGTNAGLQGTPDYVPPEVLTEIESLKVAPQWDVWSLGIVLYEALTEKIPGVEANFPQGVPNEISPEEYLQTLQAFFRNTDQKMYEKLVKNGIDEVEEPEVPEDRKQLAKLIISCLELDHTKRPDLLQLSIKDPNSLPILEPFLKDNADQPDLSYFFGTEKTTQIPTIRRVLVAPTELASALEGKPCAQTAAANSASLPVD